MHTTSYIIFIANPRGKKAAKDDFGCKNPIYKRCCDIAKYHGKIENTMKPSQVKPIDYAAIAS